jgi:hypothetical protein
VTDRFAHLERAKESLREELAEVMLTALRQQAGIGLDEKSYYRLKEKFMDALIGEIVA